MVLDIFYSKTVSIKSVKLFKEPCILVYEFQLGRVKFGSTREQIQLVVRAGLEIGASGLQFQLSNRSAILPLAHTIWTPGLKGHGKRPARVY